MQSVTAKQIADVMSLHSRSVQKRASDEAWEYNEQPGPGGQIRHYTFSQLPADVQIAVAHLTPAGAAGRAAGIRLKEEQALKESIRQSKIAEQINELHAVADDSASSANISLVIINAAKKHTESNNLAKVAGLKSFCEQYNNKAIDLPSNVYATQKQISYRTLQRWQARLEQKGVAGLAKNYGNRKGTGYIDASPELSSLALSLLREYPHMNGQHMHNAMKATYGDRFQIPAPATCRTWLATWKADNKSLWLSLIDPDGWKNKHMVSFGRMDEAVTHINQLWEFDSTPADVMLTDGRFSIVGVIDVFTRRVKCILKPTSNSDAIALLIRETVLDWGKCKTARTDNGKDYTGARIEGCFTALGIEQDITDPFSGDQKPFIERFFKTFSHSIAELCQGYIGHNVSERQRIRARLTFEQRLIEKRKKGEEKVALDVELSSKQFQQLIDSWVEHTYHHEKHDRLKCTPFQQFTSHRHEIQRLDNSRILDILLAPVPGKNGQRTVTKSDGISVEGANFIAAELGPYVGEKVFCRYNPDDIGRIYVFHLLTKEFICEAVDPELADQGISRQDIAIQARKLQRNAMKESRAQFRKETRKHNVKNIAQSILEKNEKQNGNLSAMPKPSEQFETPQTAAVAAAIEETSKPKTPQYTEKELNVFEQKREELRLQQEIAENAKAPLFKNPLHKAQYLTELSTQTELPTLDKVWLHEYRNKNRSSAKWLDKLKSLKGNTNEK